MRLMSWMSSRSLPSIVSQRAHKTPRGRLVAWQWSALGRFAGLTPNGCVQMAQALLWALIVASNSADVKPVRALRLLSARRLGLLTDQFLICAFTLSWFLATHSAFLARSHSMQLRVDTSRSEIWPLWHGRPVTYRVAPAATASW